MLEGLEPIAVKTLQSVSSYPEKSLPVKKQVIDGVQA